MSAWQRQAGKGGGSTARSGSPMMGVPKLFLLCPPMPLTKYGMPLAMRTRSYVWSWPLRTACAPMPSNPHCMKAWEPWLVQLL